MDLERKKIRLATQAYMQQLQREALQGDKAARALLLKYANDYSGDYVDSKIKTQCNIHCEFSK